MNKDNYQKIAYDFFRPRMTPSHSCFQPWTEDLSILLHEYVSPQIRHVGKLGRELARAHHRIALLELELGLRNK